MEDLKHIAVDLESVVRKLAFPRFSGTSDNKKAEQIVLEECERRNIKPKIESFKTSDFFMVNINKLPYFFMGLYVAIISVMMIANVNEFIALFFGISLLILSFSIEGIIRMLKYPSMYSKFAKVHDSHNIILDSDYETNTNNKVNIFILAHLDTKSEKPKPHPTFLIIYLSVQIGSLILSIHIIFFAMYQIITNGIMFHGSWVFTYGIILGLIDMLRILTKYYPGESVGANDDAIGVAVCMNIQKHFNEAEHKLKKINLTCVITGSEEVGEAGAYNFLKSKKDLLNPKKNHFIILDGLTGVSFYYFPSRGLRRLPFSSLILKATDSIIEQKHESVKDLKFIRMWMPPAVNTDHSPIVKLGYPAFVYASPEKVSHTQEDTPEKIDYEGVAKFYRFLVHVIEYIDSNII